jgi:outer membrane protein assembly factor BamB
MAMHARLRSSMLFSAVALCAMSTVAHSDAPVGWRYDGTGHYPNSEPPERWSTTENVRWSTPLPSWGNGSPVVSGERVFVTAEPTWLMAFNRGTGAPLWRASNGVLDAVKGAERERFSELLTQTKEQQVQLKAKQRALSRLKRSARKARDRDSSERLVQEVNQLKAEVTRLRDSIEATRHLRTESTVDIIGYASSTPVTDGKRVFALFGNGVVSAFDMSGKRLWSRWFRDSAKLKPPFPMHGHVEGHAASPLLVGDVLVVGFGTLMGLDPETGATRWDAGTFRDYGTPAVLATPQGGQVITSDGRRIRARDGVVLKGSDPLTYYTSPVVSDGRVYVTGATSDDAGRPAARAARWSLDGFAAPDWNAPLDAARHHVSPIVADGLLYALSVRGVLRVVRVSDGTLAYEKKLDLERPQASFSLAGGRLYVFGAEGRSVVLRTGSRFEQIGTNILEPLRATPFFEGKAIYVRTHDHLYRLGE